MANNKKVLDTIKLEFAGYVNKSSLYN